MQRYEILESRHISHYINAFVLQALKAKYTLFVFSDTAMKCAANDLWSELEILLKIKPHPNICNLLGFCYSEGL